MYYSRHGSLTSPLLVRFDPEMRQQIDKHLTRHCSTAAEYIRQAVAEKLRHDDEMEERRKERAEGRENTLPQL